MLKLRRTANGSDVNGAVIVIVYNVNVVQISGYAYNHGLSIRCI
jgi:hypothetical protein